jgi:hypothetical protein
MSVIDLPQVTDPAPSPDHPKSLGALDVREVTLGVGGRITGVVCNGSYRGCNERVERGKRAKRAKREKREKREGEGLGSEPLASFLHASAPESLVPPSPLFPFFPLFPLAG